MQRLAEHYRNKHALVTGGCGFIGSHVVKLLVQLNAHVTVIDNLSTGFVENIATIYDKVTFLNADITEFDSCLKATQKKELIFHLAAKTSVAQSMQEPLVCHTNNVIGTLNLLEAARKNNIKRFIFSSSAAVYGASNSINHEDSACNPTSVYGWSKLVAESLCKEYGTLFNIDSIILRYFNVVGEKSAISPARTAIDQFLQALKNNEPITIFGDGNQTRDFVPVKDVALANIVAGVTLFSHQPAIINIATGHSQSLIEIINKLKTHFPHFSQPLIFKAARTGDIQHSQADCTRYEALRAPYQYLFNQYRSLYE